MTQFLQIALVFNGVIVLLGAWIFVLGTAFTLFRRWLMCAYRTASIWFLFKFVLYPVISFIVIGVALAIHTGRIYFT